MITHLPTDAFYVIRDYLTVGNWCKLSRTNKKTADFMQKKLQELKSLHNSLYSSFISLQKNYITESRFFDYDPSKQEKKNIYIATFDEKKNECTLQIECVKKFDCIAGYIVEKNDYFIIENFDDVSQKLEKNQFAVCLRLGQSKESAIKQNGEGFYSSFLYNFAPVTNNALFEFKRPIREIRLDFPSQCKIGNTHKEVIIKAARSAESKLNPQAWGSFTSFI